MKKYLKIWLGGRLDSLIAVLGSKACRLNYNNVFHDTLLYVLLYAIVQICELILCLMNMNTVWLASAELTGKWT